MKNTLDDLPDVLTAQEVAPYLRCSLEEVWRSCREGYLRSFKRGRRTYIPKSALIELIEGKPQGESHG